MILYMYIAPDVYSPGTGADSPRGQILDVNRNVLPLDSFFASLKKEFFEVWLYTFFFSRFNTCI